MTASVRDSVELIAGTPLVLVIPALVELVKRQGLPDRWAGLAAIVIATALVMLADLALPAALPVALPVHEVDWSVRVATWILRGVVYGLAAAGLYSQRDLILPKNRSAPEGS